MFKQVFAKLFRTSSNSCANNTNNQAITSERYDQPQIYSISSCFQTNSNVQNGLTSYYNNDAQQTSQSDSSNTTLANKSRINSNERRYNDSGTRQIYIAPHCIRYTNSTLDDTIYRIDDDSLNEIAAEILDSDNMPPKLQIVHYDGNYFAINNSHLQIYKQLQLSGLITHVQADLINIEAIPVKLRNHLLQTPSHLLELDNLHSKMFLNDEDMLDYDDDENYDRTTNNKTPTNNNNNNICTTSHLNRNSLNSGSTSSDNETNTSLNDSKLVDETYEFGECENCVDTNDEDEDENDDGINNEDRVKFASSLEKNFYHDLNTEFNLMTTKKIISNELMKLRPLKSKPKLNTISQHKGASINCTKKSSQLLESNQIKKAITKLEEFNLLGIVSEKDDQQKITENDKLIESKSIDSTDDLSKTLCKREIPSVEKIKNENELECLLVN